jgi:hypothetical protein
MASAMKDEGITLSVVAAGEGSATYLDQIARLGGGEYYPAASIQNVPDIFLKETIKSVGKYTIEEPFFPIPASPSVVLRGLDPASMPPLLGYNGASAKKTARLDLITPRGDPLLATWQYGLGRSAAWTSDLKGQWARDWMNWDNFPRFASQLVSWTLPAPHIEGLSASVHHSDNQAVIEVEAVHKDGSPYNFLTGSVVIVDPDMKTKEIPLKQSGPGLYQVSASASTPGIYLIRVGINDKDRSLGQITLGSVIPYSPEYKSTGLDRSLLNQIASITGGGELSVNDLSAAFTRDLPSVENAREIWWPIMVLVAVLFPLDVALRRLIVRKKDFMLVADRLRASLRGIKSQSSARSSQPQILNRLFEARARARTHARTGSPHAQQSSILNSHPEIEKPKHGSAEHPDADNFADLNEPAAKSNTDDHQSDEDVMSRLRQAKKRARR